MAEQTKAEQREQERAEALAAAPDKDSVRTGDPVKDAQTAAEQAREAAENPLDETIPGGKYRDGDRLVNAWGEEIDESGKPKDEDAARLRAARERR
jgi:hypothetical protein